MQIATTLSNDLLIIHVQEPRIDAACAIDFKEAMRAAITPQGQRIVLDLAQVNFIDSSGLGAVVSVRKMLWPDRVLELACLTAPVEKVFHLTRMNSIFPIHATLPEIRQQAV
ncbi:STAS domain-containing protein [Pseudotabrizicola sp. L79]|uniref:STAS domain-containing protein n=1 Tax=Pseudotabrizicola sp. L79 TaxID=3118402 RepID=UPI002F9450DB